MRILDETHLEQRSASRLGENEPFQFRCHPQVACFNQCCRNLNLLLYPYDVLRLKNALRITSDAFLDNHVDVVLRPHTHFPEVLLHMADNTEKSCPFLTPAGCSVYADRPDTCRSFPIERGVFFDAVQHSHQPVYFFRPPPFCLGPHEAAAWTPATWLADQEAEIYQRMTLRWGELRRVFHDNPWGVEGPEGAKAKMAFMSAYNLDSFRTFIFKSSFLQRYRVDPGLLRTVETDDLKLLEFGLDWIGFFLYGKPLEGLEAKPS